MKKSKYFVCPHCGNLTLTTGDASITCCGRSLEPMTAKKAEESEKFHVEIIENDWFLTTGHPMEKENYISFVAFEMCIRDREQAFAKYHQKLNCMIVEPLLQGAGGMRMYDISFLERARELCDQYGVLLIFDEVATGFGRTGHRFVADVVEPDILVLGKALTGGYLDVYKRQG